MPIAHFSRDTASKKGLKHHLTFKSIFKLISTGYGRRDLTAEGSLILVRKRKRKRKRHRF